jgi:hypothetical protein
LKKRKQAIKPFLIALTFLIITFAFTGYIPNTLRPYGAYFGLICSFYFAAVSLVKGIKGIKGKDENFVIKIIAVVGSSLILLALLCFGALDMLFRTKGLPG